MSYKIVKKQKPLCVYDFYIRHEGERHRRRLKCPPMDGYNLVQQVAAADLQGREFKGQAHKLMLYQFLDTYLAWLPTNKSKKQVQIEGYHIAITEEVYS